MRATAACPELIIPQIAVKHLAFDASTFFLSVLNDRINTAPKSGGAAKNLTTVSFAPNQLLPLGDLLYYATPSVSRQNNAGIHAMPKSGGAASTLVSGIDSTVFAIEGRYLYYAERLANRIDRVALDSGDGAARTELLAEAPLPVVRTADAGFLYFTELSGNAHGFRRMPVTGGQPETVFVEADVGLVAPVLFGDDVYWFASLAGKLQRVPKAGGPAELIYQGQGSDIVRFARLVIAAGFAYIFDSNHTLYRVSLKTRARETLVEDIDLGDMAADDGALYFVMPQQGIYRLRH
jgi:hypothetical protein